jgi:hypothetical protein
MYHRIHHQACFIMSAPGASLRRPVPGLLLRQELVAHPDQLGVLLLLGGDAGLGLVGLGEGWQG